MTTKVKSIIGTIVAGIILLGSVLYISHEPPLPSFGVELPEQAADIAVLKVTIENDRQPNGKYKKRDKELINGIEYETHEYETSKGEIGYTIFITKQTDNIISQKAIATGVEQASREYDWRVIQDNNIYEVVTKTTATSTIEL